MTTDRPAAAADPAGPAASTGSTGSPGSTASTSPTRPEAPRAPRTLATRAVRRLRGAPLSVALVVATWAVGLATGVLPTGNAHEHPLAVSADALLGGRWWTVLTAPAVPGHLGNALLASALLLTVGVAAERRIGTRSAVLVALAGQAVGVLGALGTVLIATATGTRWGVHLVDQSSHGSTPVLVALVLAASARLNTLWRRRVRVVVLVGLLVLALFSGNVHDLVRLYAGAVGLLVGRLLWGRRSPQRSLVGTTREGRVLLALTVTAVVAATVLSTFSQSAIGPLSAVRAVATGTPYDASQLAAVCASPTLEMECVQATFHLRFGGITPTVLLLMPLVVQVVLADGLRRGRRAAWVGTVVLQGVLTLIGLAHVAIVLLAAPALDATARSALGISHRGVPEVWLLVPVVVPGILLALTVAARRLFPVRAPKGTYRHLGIAVGVTLAIVVALVVLLGMLMPSNFVPPAKPLTLLVDQLLRLVPSAALSIVQPTLLPVTTQATALVEVAPVLVWGVAAVGLWRSFHSHRTSDDAAGAARVRALLRSPGGPSVGWWATWPGNTWWFSPTCDAAVAYRPVAGVALTPCGPICAPENLPTVVAQFAEHAAAQGLVPALYSVHDDVADATAALGWTRLQVAEETVLDLPTLAFTGKKFQDVRTALNRATKEGIATEWHTYGALPVGLRDQIHAISEDWVSQKGLPEMGFTLGGIDELDDPSVRLLLAVDADRTVHGVTSWLPVFRDGEPVGLTLDFMRRHAEGFRPVVELLIAQAALSAKEEGLAFLSLSGAPLARTGGTAPEGGAPAAAGSRVLDDLLDRLGAALEPVYGFRSLLAFKSKFQPSYHPMYLAVPDRADLPAAATALGRAYLPDLTVGQGVVLGTTLLRR